MKKLLIALTLIAASQMIYAMPADNTQADLPTEVTADSLDIQGQAGISVYKGNVIITRGPTELKGDEVTIIHPENQFKQATVVGKLATFKHFSEVEQSWVNGQAEVIVYDALNRTLLLTGQAYINQKGQNDIAAPKIFYNLNTESLVASSTPKEKHRIKMTFTPDTAPEQP